MINFRRQKVKQSEQIEFDAKLKKETAHIKTNPVSEETWREIINLKKTELEIQKTELEIQKNESQNQTLLARGILYMFVLSLFSLFTFAGFSLYMGKNEDAKSLLNTAVNGSTYLTTAVIGYYFGSKKQPR